MYVNTATTNGKGGMAQNTTMEDFIKFEDSSEYAEFLLWLYQGTPWAE